MRSRGTVSLLLLTLFITPAFSGQLHRNRLFSFGLAAELAEERTTEYKLVRLARVSGTRFLGLFSVTNLRWDKWADREALRREALKKKSGSPPPFESREHLMLAFLDRTGKLLSRSLINLENDTLPRGLRQEDVQLFVFEVEICPYAVLLPQLQQFLCFGWQLDFLKKYTVPLEVFNGAAPVVTEQGIVVWLFGKKLAASLGSERVSPPPWMEAWNPEKGAETVPLQLDVASGKITALPFSVDQLISKIQKAGRTSVGQRPVLQRPSLMVLPLERTSMDLPVPVVITVISSSSYASEAHFVGERLFFAAEMGKQGIEKVHQLPFVFQQVQDAQPDFDTQKGVVTLPTDVIPWELRAVQLPGDAVGVYCKLLLLREEDMQREEALPGLALAFFAVAHKNQATFFDFSEIKVELRRLQTERTEITPFPFFVGMAGRFEAVFAGLCRSGETAEPCAASVDLEY